MAEIKKVLLQRPQGALPSNTLPNPREKIKSITTRSGNVLAGSSVPPPTPSSFKEEEVERDLETITDYVLTESTTKVPPPVVQPSPSSRTSEIPPPPTSFSSELPKRNPHQPQIPYPSSLNKEKLQDKSGIHVHNTIKFLIPCDFPELEKCMALADLGASINLMPLSVWKNLMIPELVPTRMTLELANRSIAYPAGIAKDVFVQVGKFTFPVDFVVVDYDVDPQVPLILGRPFLRTARALVDVYGEELILRDGDEKLIFHADSTSKHPHKHGNESINMINFIDISCEDRFQEVLKIKKSNHPLSGSPTLSSDPMVESLFPSLTPFGDIDLLLEETDAFLSLDDSIPLDLPPHELNNDPEGDILFLENLLKDEPLVTERSEIYTLIGEPPNTFLMGDGEIKINPFKDIDSLIPIPRVSETPLDSFDSSLDSFDTAFTNPLIDLDSEYTLNYDNPIFDIQNEDRDASGTKTIMDEVQIDSLQSTTQIPPLLKR
ncbi:reverse transcriptase domain-containing protein [Tanacetum coccineum]